MSPRPRLELGELSVVTFNAWTGQTDRGLRDNLVNMVGDVAALQGGVKPHAVVLQEVWDWDGSIPGYDRYAADPADFPGRKGRDADEVRSTTVLVRERGVDVRRADYIEVHGPDWRGPKHGLHHRPRVFPDLTLVVPDSGRPWDLLAGHRTPGGPRAGIKANRASWAAEDAEIADWFQRRGPQVAGMDWNNTGSDRGPLTVHDLARRVGGKYLLAGIDGFMFVDARGHIHELPGRYGGDGHRPVVGNFNQKD
jgi:hypothetical protein